MKSKKKLRIAIVCDPIGNSKAGVIVSTRRFARLLKEKGHHVIFIGARLNEYKDNSYHDGIKAYRFRSIPLPKSGGWHLALPTTKEVKEVLQQENINVVHIVLPMSGALVTVRSARALGIKIVAHSHSQPENIFMDVPIMLGRHVLYRLWNSYLAWLYSKASLIIYPTQMAYELLNNLTTKEMQSRVISNGIDTKEFRHTEIGDFYERYNIPRQTIKLVFVGRLFPEKSVDTLIRAIPYIAVHHPEVHVMIVGDGHLRSKLESLVDKLGVRKHTTFLGLASDEDKLFAYNAADIFVLPSFAELEGMVVLEAMACGKPIVISDSEMSASRHFVDNNGLLFKTANPEDLAVQVLMLIKDKTLREQMGLASIEKSKQYDIHNSVAKLEDAYLGVLCSNE